MRDGRGVTVALAARGAQVLGLEIDSERVEAARRFAEKSGVSAQYVCADAAASSSLDGYRDFDGIVLRDVVEHVADSGGMLSEAREASAGSGWMFVSFPPYSLSLRGHQHHPQSRIKVHPVGSDSSGPAVRALASRYSRVSGRGSLAQSDDDQPV